VTNATNGKLTPLPPRCKARIRPSSNMSWEVEAQGALERRESKKLEPDRAGRARAWEFPRTCMHNMQASKRQQWRALSQLAIVGKGG
jgi:hypothetical protein